MTVTAFVGCAHIHTPGFVKRLAARHDVTVKAAWDPEPERARKVADAFPGATVVYDPAAIFDDPAIDAVVICAQTDLHEQLTLPAVAAGKHVFVEKPLGLKADDAVRMAQRIDEAGVIFQTGYFRRGDPIHLFLRDQIQQGNFGQITRVRHANCHEGALDGWFDTEWRWMADRTRAGVGGFGDLGTHSLDILLWWFGEVAQVTAQIDSVTGRYPGCDEYGEGLIRFKNGVIATLAAGWSDISNPVSLEICGTEGHAHVVNRDQLFFTSGRVANADGAQPWTDLPDALPHAFELFFDAVSGQPDVPLVTAQEAAYRNVVMDALYAGAAQDNWISL